VGATCGLDPDRVATGLPNTVEAFAKQAAALRAMEYVADREVTCPHCRARHVVYATDAARRDRAPRTRILRQDIFRTARGPSQGDRTYRTFWPPQSRKPDTLAGMDCLKLASRTLHAGAPYCGAGTVPRCSRISRIPGAMAVRMIRGIQGAHAPPHSRPIVGEYRT
jgi:hypothetical protein